MKKLFVIAMMLSLTGCTIVPANHVAVTEVFGKVNQETWRPGIHFVPPWMGAHTINCRTQQNQQPSSTPTSEGMIVELDVSLVYHYNPTGAVDLYARYGGDAAFYGAIVEPELRSAIRDVTASFRAADLYGANRAVITSAMEDTLRSRLQDRPVVIESVLLRDIRLPDQLTQAIQNKLEADQQAQQMEFVLQKETQEAERKRIEAAGIRDFQNIVTRGITPALLKWKGIEATEQIAISNNAKVIIVSGDDLPVILGGQ